MRVDPSQHHVGEAMARSLLITTDEKAKRPEEGDTGGKET